MFIHVFPQPVMSFFKIQFELYRAVDLQVYLNSTAFLFTKALNIMCEIWNFIDLDFQFEFNHLQPITVDLLFKYCFLFVFLPI